MKRRGQSARAAMAGFAALLPAAALATAGEAESPAARSDPFTPPPSGAVLTREVRRPLAPGVDLVVRRSFALDVQRDGNGYLVNGRQVAVEVDAPPSLAVLADLERQRQESLLFPLRLDARGIIMPDSADTAGHAHGADDLPQANAFIAGLVAQSNLSSAERQQVRTFLTRSLPQGGFGHPPANMFHPLPGKRSEAKSFLLPDGEPGRLIVATEASTGHGAGLLASTTRTITTEYAGTERVNRETWRIDYQPRTP